MTTETLPVPVVTSDQVELIRRTVAAGATDDELKLHLYNCQRRGIHPLDGLLHFTKRGGKYTPVASIDLMRSRAAETGDYAGNDDPKFTGQPGQMDFAATVTVWRIVQGQRYPFTATARWPEYYPGDVGGHMWRKMPHVMLGKVAEALALRKAFPQTLSGLYESAEMDQADTPAPVTVTQSSPPLPPAPPKSAKRVGPVYVSNDQIKRLFAIGLGNGWEKPAIIEVIKAEAGVESSKEIRCGGLKGEYDALVKIFEAGPEHYDKTALDTEDAPAPDGDLGI